MGVEPTLSEALASVGLTHDRDEWTPRDGKRSISDANGYLVGRYDWREAWEMVRKERGYDH